LILERADDDDDLAGADRVALGAPSPVDEDVTGFDPSLGAGALTRRTGQELVEP
jgi:hypothetical protein